MLQGCPEDLSPGKKWLRDKGAKEFNLLRSTDSHFLSFLPESAKRTNQTPNKNIVVGSGAGVSLDIPSV